MKPQVRGGVSHTAALRSNGTVWAWGDNAHGQLGDGSTVASSTTPTQVRIDSATPLTDIVSIAAGREHSVAVRADGALFAWGDNAQGQLGDGTVTDSRWAVRVRASSTAFLTDVRSVTAGTFHSAVVLDDGSVWTWGSNANGELGTGDTTSSRYPVQARLDASTPLTGVKEIAAGSYHTIALRPDGSVYGWGFNGGGQTGSGDAITPQPWVIQSKATSTTFIGGVKAIATCGNCTLILEQDGDVLSFGSGASGQLGHGTTTSTRFPAQVLVSSGTPLPKARSIGGGDGGNGLYRGFAVTADGRLYGWGNNGNGELGTGDATIRTYATGVTTDGTSPLEAVSTVGGGGTHTFAFRADGRLRGWGLNSSGQLGTGTTTSSLLPVGGPSIAGTGLTSVAAGTAHSVGLRADGSAWAWGANASGQLGDGTTVGATSGGPVLVGPGTRLANLVAVAAAGDTSFALRVDGTVWAWGSNSDGQLGTGATGGTSSYAVQVLAGAGTPFAQVIGIAAGSAHAVGLRSDGSVWTWGDNANGQLGDGTTTDRAGPVQAVVAGGNPVAATQVASRSAHSLALGVAGRVLAWGANAAGQLGDGTTTQSLVGTPVLAAASVPLEQVIRVAAGGTHSLAVTNAGALVSWGGNADGQLGDGTTTPRSFAAAPVAAPGGASLRRIADAAGGDGHTVAVARDGTVHSAGRNSSGQLCDGSTTARLYAVQAHVDSTSPLLSVVTAAAGSAHGLLLRNSGAAWACGANADGQLGTQSTTPAGWAVESRVRPDAPQGADQYQSDATTVIPIGAVTSSGLSTDLVFQFTVRDINEAQTLTPWVELVADGASFSGTCGVASATMRQGTAVATTSPQQELLVSVRVSSLTNGSSYRWRACLADQGGLASEWYVHGGSPDFIVDDTIIDNQAGDDAWRRANVATYDVDFRDDTGLVDFAVQAWSGAGGGGVLVHDWAQVAALSGTSYTTNWSLPATVWSALPEGTTFISVRRQGTSPATTTRRDVFHVRKDTTAPGAVSPSGSSPTTAAPALTWALATDPSPGSGTAYYRVYRSTSSGALGSLVSTDGSVTSGSFTDSALATSGTYYYTVRAVDAAGNERADVGTQAAIQYTAPLYLHSTASTLLTSPAAGRRLRTLKPSGAADTSTSVPVAKSTTSQLNTFVQWRPGTGTTAAPVTALPSAPNGYGWVDEESPSRSYVSGAWRFSVPLSFDRSVSGTINVKAWKVNLSGGAITNPVEICASAPPCAWTESASVSGNGTYTVDATMPAISFGAGEYLYVEYWWKITGQVNQAAVVTFSTNVTGSHIVPTQSPAAASISLSVDAADVSTGPAYPGQDATATSVVSVTTDAANGYSLAARDEHDSWGADQGTSVIADWTASADAPAAWTAGAAGYMGVTVRDATGGRLGKWGTAGGGFAEANFVDNLYAGLEGTSDGVLHTRATPTSGSDAVTVTYRINPAATQPAGSYTATVAYTATARP